MTAKNIFISARESKAEAGNKPTILTGITKAVNPRIAAGKTVDGNFPKSIILSNISVMRELPTHLKDTAAMMRRMPAWTATPPANSSSPAHTAAHDAMPALDTA
jgi:hypothetical protein